MDLGPFLAFVGVSAAVIVVPGPSVLLIVSNSLQCGIRDGILTAVGVSAAMVIQLAAAVAGITSVVFLLADWFAAVRWIGIVYLIYLGVSRLRERVAVADLTASPGRRGAAGLLQGFVVSLTNPTTLTFFVAFFPQFLNMEGSIPNQFALMSVTFWVLAAAFDIVYVLLAARLGKTLQNKSWMLLRNRLSGSVMLLAALALAWLR